MGDVLTNFIQLAWVSALSTGALQVIYDTRFYQINFGKGPDGEGNNTSRFFKRYELRPWIALALGVFLAYQFTLTAMIDGLGIDLATLVAVSGETAVHVDKILTGISISGGCKTIKFIASSFADARKDITSTVTG